MKILLDKIIYDKNLTIRQVSYITGIPRSTIDDIVNHRSMPRIDTLEQIAKGLKIHITDLIDSSYL